MNDEEARRTKQRADEMRKGGYSNTVYSQDRSNDPFADNDDDECE